MFADPSNIGAAYQNEILTPGEKFGDYQVMDCIQFGLFGGLYRMQHIREFDEVCMQVMPQAASAFPGFKERVGEIVEKLKSVDHPNVHKVERVEFIKDRACLIMEQVEGVNLSAYLETFVKEKRRESGAIAAEPRTEPAEHADGDADEEKAKRERESRIGEQDFGLPPGVVRDVLKQAAEAVKAVNAKGAHHLFLNPDVLILDPEGKVTVTGFGLAEMAGQEAIERLVSAYIPPIQIGPRQLNINTLDHLSPEVRNGEPPDTRSDIYALGITTHFLLTGHRFRKDAPPVSSTSAAIVEGWDTFAERCLRAEPDKRYQKMDSVISDLDRIDRLGGTRGMTKGIQKEEDTSEGLDSILARVPVPHSVRSRLKPTQLRALRLGVVGAFAAAVVSLAAICYTIIFMDMGPEDSGATVRKSRPGIEPDLIIVTDPPTVRIRFSGKGRGSFVITDGRLSVNMPPGVYSMSVEAPDFRTDKVSNIEIGKEPRRAGFTLQPAWAELVVRSKPGAVVKVSRDGGADVAIGKVPESGLFEAEQVIVAGDYRVTVELENYFPVVFEDVNLPVGSKVTRTAELQPKPARLLVESDPEGAEVSIGGEVVGKTPHQLEDLEPFSTIEVSVQLDGYRGKLARIELEPGMDETVPFGQLEARMGSVELAITAEGQPFPEEELKRMSVKIGDAVYPADKPLPPIAIGAHDVSIEHPEYLPETTKVAILDRKAVTAAFDLTPRPGYIRVRTEPIAPFTLVVNGRRARAVEGESNVFEITADEASELQLLVRDHYTAKRTVNLSPSERIDWTVNLIPIPGPELEKEWQVPYIGLSMAWVEPGSFRLGSELKEQARLPEEGPPTLVTLTKGFWLGIYEVTQLEFQRALGANPSSFRYAANHEQFPVENVSWLDAQIFCRKLNESEREAGRLPEGYEYRLPTEAEWEYAASEGKEQPFSWGEQAYGVHGNFAGSYPRDFVPPKETERNPGTVKVGSYEPNEWGLYDMHGNVREWCHSYYEGRYPGRPVTDYVGPREGTDRVIRGGGWESLAKDCRTAARDRLTADSRANSLGFRLALAPIIEDQ